MTSDTPKPAPKWHNPRTDHVVGGVIGGLIVLVVGTWIALKQGQSRPPDACAAPGRPITRVEGVVRRAGSDFFVQSTQWHRISGVCPDGRHREACLQRNPGVRALEIHLGKPVTVEFCLGQAVSYTLDRHRYELVPTP